MYVCVTAFLDHVALSLRLFYGFHPNSLRSGRRTSAYLARSLHFARPTSGGFASIIHYKPA